MSLARRFYHFLGSIYFAITLIALTAAFVITGTVLESLTESHKYAALFTYGSPIFSSLLWGFFINILISALRRWPFKYRHIPFLITHWGLLMVLAGTLIKSYFGLQGTMTILEGTGSQEIYLPDSFVVQIEKRDPANSAPISKRYLLHAGNLDPLGAPDIENDPFAELRVQLVSFAPHSSEIIETWIKNDKAWITGMKPFEVQQWHAGQPAGQPWTKVQAKVWDHPELIWDLMAFRTDNVQALLETAYAKYADIIVRDSLSGRQLFEGPLQAALNQPVKLEFGTLSLSLNCHWSPVIGFREPALLASLDGPNLRDRIKIPLQGPEALLNQNESRPHLGSASITIDLLGRPTVVIAEDPQGDVFLFAFDPQGKIFGQAFRSDNLNEVIAYDQGFGGYSVRTKIPFTASPCSRKDIEASQLHTLAVQLRQGPLSSDGLVPPLKVLYEACRKQNKDFGAVCVAFLEHWDKCQSWLYPENIGLPEGLEDVFAELDWSLIPSDDRKGCGWTSSVFHELDPKLKSGEDLIDLLDKLNWPLLYSIVNSRPPKGLCLPEEWLGILEQMTKQIFAVAGQLPDPETVPSKSEPLSSPVKGARLLSAYLRAYSIHLKSIVQTGGETEARDRLKFYTASQVFTHCVKRALAGHAAARRDEQAPYISSLPSDSAPFLEMRQAYGQMLQLLRQPFVLEEITPGDLAEAFRKFSPITPMELNGNDCSQILANLDRDLVELESPLSLRLLPQKPLKKLEDNLPAITLKLAKGSSQEYISLGYDRSGSGIKWPAFQGEYLLRFQPELQTIPYRLRLRQARQINYPNSQQAFSYESDLIVTDTLQKSSIEKTISMNNVHETWDGYRFYLANIAPPDDAAVKRVQIVVNRDPAKYILTYPGAIIMTLGIILLFWMKFAFRDRTLENPFRK